MQLQVLRRGSKGNDVKALQAILTGYSYDAGDIDGIFGPKVESAVKLYQKNHLTCGTPDGIVGEKTWKTLLGV